MPVGSGKGVLLGGRTCTGSFALHVEILEKVSGRVLMEYSSAFQVCSSRILVSTDWLVPGLSREMEGGESEGVMCGWGGH